MYWKDLVEQLVFGCFKVVFALLQCWSDLHTSLKPRLGLSPPCTLCLKICSTQVSELLTQQRKIQSFRNSEVQALLEVHLNYLLPSHFGNIYSSQYIVVQVFFVRVHVALLEINLPILLHMVM